MNERKTMVEEVEEKKVLGGGVSKSIMGHRGQNTHPLQLFSVQFMAAGLPACLS